MMFGLHVVLVTGGRDYAEPKKVYGYMDAVSFLLGGSIVLVHGGATGLDSLAEAWAKSREQIHICVPAEWSKYGKRAGMRRNSEMGVLATASIAVAFRGGRGTLGMISVIRNLEPKPELILPDGEFWK